MSETMVERVARAIAKDNGDDFDAIPQDKQDWIANHSATGRFRDVNEPRRDDYLSMARAAIEAMPFERLIINAYLRGVEWNEENPLDREYRFKAAEDYADKTISALSQSHPQSPNTADTTSAGDAS